MEEGKGSYCTTHLLHKGRTLHEWQISMIYDLQKEYVGLCHSAGKTPRSLPLIDKSRSTLICWLACQSKVKHKKWCFFLKKFQRNSIAPDSIPLTTPWKTHAFFNDIKIGIIFASRSLKLFEFRKWIRSRHVFISHRVQANCKPKKGVTWDASISFWRGCGFYPPSRHHPSQTNRCHVAFQIHLPKTIVHPLIPTNKQQPFVGITYSLCKPKLML